MYLARFKSRHHTQDGFTISANVKTEENCLRVPSIGWLQLKGSDPHAINKSLQGRIKQEGTRTSPSGIGTSPMQCRNLQ